MAAMPPTDELWPPKSARHALLGSPSGRKRYADFQAGKSTSPIKPLSTSPSLLDRLRLARRTEDNFESNDDEYEDEETLQLKLAAIEAKLKLKRLQNKTKREEDLLGWPASAEFTAGSKQDGLLNSVEVSLSPVKRPFQAVEPRSPSRVVLGIDKGVRGSDISLRRAKTTISPAKEKGSHISGGSKRSGTNLGTVSTGQQRAKGVEVQSFSERMAEIRDRERADADKKETAARSRTKNFNLDAAEMERFKAGAEDTQESPFASAIPLANQSLGLGKTETSPDSHRRGDGKTGDSTLFEGFSRTHLSSRILPHSFLKRTLPKDRYSIYRVPDLLKDVISPAYELPDHVGDYVVFGIIASKSNPLDSNRSVDQNVKVSNAWTQKWDDGLQNRKKFIVMTLTDLKWTVDLYLFDTAVPRYHRLTPGTVIAILNPSIMRPRKGKENTGAFSLALHDGDDTVLEIGTSKDLEHCEVIKKDGGLCGQWVNGAKTKICEWHLNAQIAKIQSKRMGVNTGANGFGSKSSHSKGTGKEETKTGRGFDWHTASHYYITSSKSGAKVPPMYNPAVSTVHMLDADSSDPFIAEGQFSRDKEALIKKRLASQEKERDIAKQLATLGSGTSAGANYMRKRAHGDTSLQPCADDVVSHAGNPRIHSSLQSASHTTSNIRDAAHNLKSEIGRKRTAQDVRLSPVKKRTRFLTDHRVKEAGRESLKSFPANPGIRTRPNISDEDDDLDIV